MIIKTPISSNQELIPDIFLAGGVTYSPNWQKEALKMLRMQSGNVARIVTAMIFLGEKFELINVSFAEYKFAKFDETDLQNYLSGDLWQGKAGAMTIENFNKKYILSQNGETSTAMGLNAKILKAFLFVVKKFFELIIFWKSPYSITVKRQNASAYSI